MQDAFAYCAELVRTADRDSFIASLFAPAERRGAPSDEGWVAWVLAAHPVRVSAAARTRVRGFMDTPGSG